MFESSSDPIVKLFEVSTTLTVNKNKNQSSDSIVENKLKQRSIYRTQNNK